MCYIFFFKCNLSDHKLNGKSDKKKNKTLREKNINLICKKCARTSIIILFSYYYVLIFYDRSVGACRNLIVFIAAVRGGGELYILFNCGGIVFEMRGCHHKKGSCCLFVNWKEYWSRLLRLDPDGCLVIVKGGGGLVSQIGSLIIKFGEGGVPILIFNPLIHPPMDFRFQLFGEQIKIISELLLRPVENCPIDIPFFSFFLRMRIFLYSYCSSHIIYGSASGPGPS